MCEPNLTSFAKSMVLPDNSAVHDKNDSGQLSQVSREQERVCVFWVAQGGVVRLLWREFTAHNEKNTLNALVRSTQTLRLQHIYYVSIYTNASDYALIVHSLYLVWGWIDYRLTLNSEKKSEFWELIFSFCGRNKHPPLTKRAKIYPGTVIFLE